MGATADAGERIMDAAVRLLSERGYAGTSTRAIADLAGVNEVTLFRRFGSKQGLLQALSQQFFALRPGYTALAQTDSDDVRTTLLELARREITKAAEAGGLALRLAFEARSVPEVAELIGQGPSSNQDDLAEYLAQHQATGELRDDIDAHVLAEAFFGLTSSYVMYRIVMGMASMPADVDSDEGIIQLFDVFWSGAAAKG